MSGYAPVTDEKLETVYLRPSSSAPKQRTKLSTARGIIVPLAFVIVTLTFVTVGYEVWNRRPPTWKAVSPAFTATSYQNALQFDKSEICLSRRRKGSYVTRTISLFLDNEVTASFKPEVVHLEYVNPGDHSPACFDPFLVSPPAFKLPPSMCNGQDNLRGAVTFEMKHIDRDDQQVTVVPHWEGKSPNGVSSTRSVGDVVGSVFHGPTRDALIVPLIVKCVNSNLEPPIAVEPMPVVAYGPGPYPVARPAASAMSEPPKDDTSKLHGKAEERHPHEKGK
jgi:hypothetical protein